MSNMNISNKGISKDGLNVLSLFDGLVEERMLVKVANKEIGVGVYEH